MSTLSDAAAPGVHLPAPAVQPATARRIALGVAGVACATGVLALLVRSTRGADAGALLQHPRMVVLAVGCVVAGYALQATTWHLLCARPVGRARLAAMPWASASLNRLTPAGMGGMWLTSREMRRSGASTSQTVATISTFSLLQAGAGLVLGSAAMGLGLTTHVSGRAVLISIGVIGAVVTALAAVLAAGPFRARCSAWRSRMRPGFAHLSRRRLCLALALQITSRLVPVVLLALSLQALGSPLALATTTGVVLTASAAGSLVPLPAQGGGTELAMTAMLSAAGPSPAVAASAVVTARLIGFWGPAVLGLVPLVWLGSRSATAGQQGVRLLG